MYTTAMHSPSSAGCRKLDKLQKCGSKQIKKLEDDHCVVCEVERRKYTNNEGVVTILPHLSEPDPEKQRKNVWDATHELKKIAMLHDRTSTQTRPVSHDDSEHRDTVSRGSSDLLTLAGSVELVTGRSARSGPDHC